MVKTRFAHVSINCDDMNAIERFYTRHFGFRRARVVPLGANQIVFLKNDDGVYLELFAAESKPPQPKAEQDGPHFSGVRHIAFQVANLEQKMAEIGKDAVVSLGPLTFDDFIPGWKTVWLKDPEGNIVEVSEGYVDQDHPPSPPA